MSEEYEYLGNLECPDLRPNFKHVTFRAMPHSFGRLVPSDWSDKADGDPIFGIYKRCGMWCREEAAILYNAALASGPSWVDIGAHTGWTTAHLINAAVDVTAIDPMLRLQGFQERFEANMAEWFDALHETSYLRSDEWFAMGQGVFDGFCIDGDHEPGKPLEDAWNAWRHLAPTGVIIFHDFIGRPVRDAVAWLMDQGFKCRLYFTPHMVALCWRGDYEPPYHVPDARLLLELRPHLAQMKDFDFGKCV